MRYSETVKLLHKYSVEKRMRCIINLSRQFIIGFRTPYIGDKSGLISCTATTELRTFSYILSVSVIFGLDPSPRVFFGYFSLSNTIIFMNPGLANSTYFLTRKENCLDFIITEKHASHWAVLIIDSENCYRLKLLQISRTEVIVGEWETL